MKDLLTSNKVRQLNFLEYLIQAEDWHTLKTISTAINESQRVLKNDILEINSYLFPFEIKTSKKRGVLITYPDNYSIDYIYTRFLFDSLAFSLLELLFFERSLDTETIITSLFTSQSSLRRLIQKINRILAPINIAISAAPYKIVGSEIAIRNFFTQLFLEKYPKGDFPFNKKNATFLDSFITYAFTIANIRLCYSELNTIRAATLTNLIRLSQGYSLLDLTGPENPHLALLCHAIVEDKNFHAPFNRAFNLHLTYDLVYEIFYRDFQPFYLSSPDLSLDKPRQSLALMINISHFLDFLSRNLNVEIDNHARLIFELYKKTKFYFSTAFILYDRNDFFREYVKKEFSLLIPTLERGIAEFFPDKVSTKNNAFVNMLLYTLMIHWKNLPLSLKKHAIPVKIGLFVDLGHEHSWFISQLLNRSFSKQIETTSLIDLSIADALLASHNYDIVITNISELTFSSTHTICINSLPTVLEWEKIRTVLLALAK